MRDKFRASIPNEISRIKAVMDRHIPRAVEVKLRVFVFGDTVSVEVDIDHVEYFFVIDGTDTWSAYRTLRAHLDSLRSFEHRKEYVVEKDAEDAEDAEGAEGAEDAEDAEEGIDATSLENAEEGIGATYELYADNAPDDLCPGFVRYEKQGRNGVRVRTGMLQPDGRIRPFDMYSSNPYKLGKPKTLSEGYKRVEVSREWLLQFCPMRYSDVTDTYNGEANYSTLTLDNGGNPFCVRANSEAPLRSAKSSWLQYGPMRSHSNIAIAAYRVPFLKTVPESARPDGSSSYYTHRIWHAAARSFFTGGNGSSVLVEMAPSPAVHILVSRLMGEDVAELVQTHVHTYVFIGDCIYQFTTSEPIVAFFSPIGNSDETYPVAISETRSYYMRDRRHGPRPVERGMAHYAQGEAYRSFYENESNTLPMEHAAYLYGSPPS